VILLALPGEPARADAVGEGKEDRDAAARGAAVVEELRVAVEQVELLPFVPGLPLVAVEAERWPDFRPHPGRGVFQDVDGAVEAGSCPPLICPHLIGHGFPLPMGGWVRYRVRRFVGPACRAGPWPRSRPAGGTYRGI